MSRIAGGYYADASATRAPCPRCDAELDDGRCPMCGWTPDDSPEVDEQ